MAHGFDGIGGTRLDDTRLNGNHRLPHSSPQRFSRSDLSTTSSRPCYLPPDLLATSRPYPATSRAFDRFQTLPLPPELPAASKPSRRLQTLPLPLEPSTASRPWLYLQTLSLPPDVASTSRCEVASTFGRCLYLQTFTYYHVQALLPPPDLAATSRPCCHLQTLLPPPDLTATSRPCCSLQTLLLAGNPHTP